MTIKQKVIDYLATAQLESERFKDLLLRIKCLLLLSKIPNEGIPEFYETMNEIYEFYSTRSHSRSFLPQPQKIQARLGESIVRPEFPIAEDEE